ncbi:hypothetical protein M422DRAFT_36044 [Sphaerobolus stellatus SS14]|uniref:cystathionine gamma-lyase n=1 Tax=Sphaerobolus stellatus (strain SS14) TaxID=990650 RepID=A0A0C9V3I7_SPHS4|nr:hypothetical protein M422DRAFT_36044 [Sphaerobolus stellatus SS14]
MSPSIVQSNGHSNGHTATNGHATNGSQSTPLPAKPTHANTSDGFSTRAIHIGSEHSSETGAVIPPISLSTTYAQSAVGVHKGFEYTRSLNPNRDSLERMLAGLETNGGKALAFASGSATTATILQALGTGAHVLSINDVYGGTFRYMSKVASQLQGLETTFVDFDSATDEEVLASIRPNTKLIWIETPTNPTLRLPPIAHITSLIHSLPAASRPLIAIDSTFLSPFYVSPLSAPISADLAVHSITKYINGHSDVLMGAVILPNASTAEANGNKDTIDALYARLQFLQNAHGAVPGAFDAWLALRGAKTLSLRMKEHGRSAIKLARFLLAHPLVKEVIYPGLAEHPGHNSAAKILAPHARKFVDEWVLADEAKEGNERKGKGDFPFGGMVSFRIGRAGELADEGAAERFLTRTRLFTLAESLGGVESLAELPEKMTHGSIPPAERLALGITPDLVRLSVGVEDIDDLIADVEQALSWAVEGWNSTSTSVASSDSE